MDFQEDIKQWVSTDNQIKIFHDKIKELRNQRYNLTEKIFNYAEHNNLQHAVIQITGGKLKFQNTKVSSPLTFRFVQQCLTECLPDPDNEARAKAIINYIKSKRDINLRAEIKRIYNKT